MNQRDLAQGNGRCSLRWVSLLGGHNVCPPEDNLNL